MIRKGFMQRIRRRGKPVVSCNRCYKVMRDIKPKYKKVGEIEYRYMICKNCSAVYVVSATDEALRRDIKRFEEMTNTAEVLSEERQREAQALLNANVARSRQLKEQYPLELKPGER